MKYRNAFLLFEALVAIVIASTSLVVILQGLGSALRGANIAENYFKASILAEAQLALYEKEIGVKTGQESGRPGEDVDPDNVFSWEQKSTQVTMATLFETEELPICKVELTVKWKERKGERNVKFVTYLPKYKPSPAER